MLERIAVDLGRRGNDEARVLGLRQPERLVGAERADLQRGYRQLEIIDRARGARPVQDHVDGSFHIDVVRDVVLDEHEVPAGEMGDVRGVACQQVVDTNDRMSAVEQGLREVRPDEAGGAGDNDPGHKKNC